MNHHHSTTTDFRYLDINNFGHRFEIELGLADMGTSSEVIHWFFSQVDELEAELREARASDKTIIQ